MQSFNFGLRKASEGSIDHSYGRPHIPSSVYSGPGPAEEEEPVYGNHASPQNLLRDPFLEEQHTRYQTVGPGRVVGG